MKRSEAKQEEEGSERTCVGCREATDPGELERFVMLEGQLVYDMRRRAPGRGAWVHARPQCVERAVRGGFGRSFKHKIEGAQVAQLVRGLREGIERRVIEALQVEVRCGQASMGADAVAEGLRARRIAAVLVAQDAGRSTRERAEHQAAQAEVPVIELWDGARLGALFGRESVVLVGIGDRARAERLAQDCKSLVNLAAFEG